MQKYIRMHLLLLLPIVPDSFDLVDLVIKYYDKLDEKYQKYIPLKMVYIPIMNSDDDTSVSVSG